MCRSPLELIWTEHEAEARLAVFVGCGVGHQCVGLAFRGVQSRFSRGRTKILWTVAAAACHRHRVTSRPRDRRHGAGRGGRAGSAEAATVVVAYAAFVFVGVSV